MSEAADSPKVGDMVNFNHDGKTSGRATVVAVNKDGTLDLNAHAKGGHIIGGFAKCKRADGMNHGVAETWWL